MSWPEEMDQHCDTFREVWREHGREHLFPGFSGGLVDNSDVLDELLDPDGQLQDMDQRIRNMFTSFRAGDPDAAERSVSLLDDAYVMLVQDEEEHLGGIDRNLRDWRGEAADDFYTYVTRMRDALTRKQDCVRAAGEVMFRYRTATEEYRRNILDLVDQTYQLLDEVRAAQAEAAREFKVTVMTSIITAAALFVPGGGAMAGPVTAGVIATITTGALAAESLSMGAATEGGVIASAVEHGERIIADAREANARIARGFFSLTEQVTNLRGDLHQVRPDRPGLITDDTFDPEQFRPEDATGEVTDRVDRDAVVTEPPRDEDQRRDHAAVDPAHRPLPSPDIYPEQ